MSKVDISITRSLTINTGNYESIKPTVTVTARDINPTDVGEVYQCIDGVISGMMTFEIINCASESKMVGGGLDQFCKQNLRRSEEIGDSIEESLSKLERY